MCSTGHPACNADAPYYIAICGLPRSTMLFPLFHINAKIFGLRLLNVICVLVLSGTALAQWLRCCATNRKVAGSIPAGVSGFFNDIKSFRSHCGPGVESASNKNEYQMYFLEGKDGRCVRLTTLPPSCAVVTKSGNLNFLEPSGPLRACNGTLTFFLVLSTNFV